MSKVHVLASDVIARIAAGEVVDRPAAVLKELMENALDAGARRIEVTLKDGGRTLIQVKDDGSGIARDDLDRLFNRHATSKITGAEDLDALTSFGFRGEALYSISAVADVSLRTRLQGTKDGWEMRVRGGARQPAEPVAVAANGTDIRVEDLFFNTPARKKFLKAGATEFSAAANVFVNCALLEYQCYFALIHNGRAIYDLKPAATAALRAAECLNLDAAHIVEIREEIPGSNIRVGLVLGDINIQRPRRDQQYLFVNGRPVQHKNLMFNVNDVFRMIMPDGAHPFFIIYLALPPEDVDVNIHPQKREVRIKDEGRLTGILRSAVERLLMTQGSARQAEPLPAPDWQTDNPAGAAGVAEPGRPVFKGIPSDKIIFGPQSAAGSPSGPARPAFDRPDGSFDREFFRAQADTFRAAGAQPNLPPMALGQEADSSLAHRMAAPVFAVSLKDRLLAARFLGTFACKYHLFEEGEALFVVDQHAAQERIMFERIIGQIAAGRVEVQRLLIPVAVRLTPAEIAVWEELKEKLDILGFETGLLSGQTVSITAHPAGLSCPETVLRALLADEAVLKSDTDGLARRACRSSVMSGQRMPQEAARQQLRELMSCRDPLTCPHGRPVFIEMKMSFLDKQFFRI